MDPQLVDRFGTILTGIVFVALSVAICAAFGSPLGVAFGLLSLGVAYLINFYSAEGEITSTETWWLIPMVFVSWVAGVVSAVAAVIAVC